MLNALDAFNGFLPNYNGLFAVFNLIMVTLLVIRNLHLESENKTLRGQLSRQQKSKGSSEV